MATPINATMIAVQNRLSASVKAELAQKGNEIFKSLVTERSDMHGKLPEPIFRDYFLPYFTGEKTIASNPQVISQWIGVSGTPMNEVDIINQQGVTIFTCPPLYDTAVIKMGAGDRTRTLADIFGEYSARMNNIPSIAENRLAMALADKTEAIIDKTITTNPGSDRWTEVLARYNKVPIDALAKEVKSNSLDDDICYD